MQDLLNQLDLNADAWTLLPVETVLTSSGNSRTSAQDSASAMSSQLTPILTNALNRIRSIVSSYNNPDPGPVVFLGMDSPQLPLEEMASALNVSTSASSEDGPAVEKALLCPCPDGGYGMLSVPANAPADKIFDGVQWSHPLTALSQLKALSDAGVAIRMGRLMYDMDEPDDVHDLCRRLQESPSEQTTTNAVDPDDNCLLRSSTGVGQARTSDCPRTRQALMDLGLLPTTPNTIDKV